MIFPNIIEDDKEEFQFKILIVKEYKEAYLLFNFKNDKLSDIMLAQ
ncbi:hypothetical protein HNQ02_003727 [Flavobacterium sp. 7E]|nr:hypothetical protein [Flavobacterium sp. 7E]